MRTFTLFGLRFMSERAWRAHVEVVGTDRVGRLVAEDALRRVIHAGSEFSDSVRQKSEENTASARRIHEAVEKVLSCNVTLAHRAEQAEADAQRLRVIVADAARNAEVRDAADLLAETLELVLEHPDRLEEAARNALVSYRHLCLEWKR